MKTKYIFETQQLIPPINGYKYNVRVKISIDGGKTYNYTGLGWYCKSLSEAIDISVEQSIKAQEERLDR